MSDEIIKILDDCEKCDAHRFGLIDTPEEPRTDDFDMSKLLHKHTPNEPRTDAVDIHKIIDDAMEKGDRMVSLMIHDRIISVTITPYQVEIT